MINDFFGEFFGGVAVFVLIFCTPGGEFAMIARKFLHFITWTSFLITAGPPDDNSGPIWPYVCANFTMLFYIMLWNMSNGWVPVLARPLAEESARVVRQYTLALLPVAALFTLACILVYENKTYATVLLITQIAAFIRDATTATTATTATAGARKKSD